ncbi:hypothetical protein Q8A73_017105 [Channa argus]|nr:hypothetical protein Q8A73_017105 [Channa argus]
MEEIIGHRYPIIELEGVPLTINDGPATGEMKFHSQLSGEHQLLASPGVIFDLLTPKGDDAGAVVRLNASYLMAKERERGNSRRAVVTVVMVIGTLSLPGYDNPASHFLSLSFSESDCGSFDTLWRPPPSLPPTLSFLFLSLSHDFLFPVPRPPTGARACQRQRRGHQREDS